MNLIILEGPPGSGKSVLANRLFARGYEQAKINLLRPAASEAKAFEDLLTPLIQAADRRIVFENSIFGERIRNEKSRLSLRTEDFAMRYLEAKDAQVVIALPPWRIVLANWLKRLAQRNPRTVAELAAIYRAYGRLIFNQGRPFVWYDYTRQRASAYADQLAAGRGYPLPAGVVGSQNPRFLFVGERANHGPDLPFLSPRGCGGWFYDVISEAGFTEREVAFVNARDPRGRKKDLHAVVAKIGDPTMMPLQGPTIIALGKAAQRDVSAAKLGFIPFEHPQYVKRFKARERAEYVAALAHARRGAL